MTEAGFEHVLVQREAATFTYGTPEEWWQSRWSLVFRSALEALPPPALAEMQAEALVRTGRDAVAGGPDHRVGGVVYARKLSG